MTFRAWSGLSVSVLLILISEPAPAQVDRPAAGGATNGHAMSAKAQEAFDAAYTLAKKGDAEGALELYEQAARLAPNNADVWQEYAICLRQTYHLQRAAKVCWRAMELKGQTAELWGNMGNIYICAEAWKAARLAYDKAATLSNDKRWAAQNFLNLGYRQWQAGDNDGAAKSFAHALKLDPTNGMAVLDMASVKATLGNTKEALKQIDEAKRLLEAEGNQRGLKYAQIVENAVRKTKHLPPPTEFTEFQPLPERFLTQPPKGKALSLRIDPMVRKSFRVSSGVVVSITVRESWKTGLDSKAVPGKPTITFAPAKGDEFQLLWTPLGVSAGRAAKLKGSLEKSANDLLPQAVEKSIELKELKSPSMKGYYFLMTDKSLVGKAPEKGQYLYGVFCSVIAGDVGSTLTVLSRRNDERFIKEMTDAITSISLDKTPADEAK